MMICRIGPTVCLTLIVLGCQGCSSHPPNVPVSAAHVENTFIVCSADSPSRGNQCTVYGEDSGEILADGLFVTMGTHTSVDKAELQYATVGHGMIYLQDGRVLVHVRPTERDSSRAKVVRRLASLAAKGSSQVIDCSSNSAKAAGSPVQCSLKSLAERRAFYAIQYSQGAESFEYTGVAADEAGNAYELSYKSAWVAEREDVMKDSALFDDGHTLVTPCPKPVTVYQHSGLLSGHESALTCHFWPQE